MFVFIISIDDEVEETTLRFSGLPTLDEFEARVLQIFPQCAPYPNCLVRSVNGSIDAAVAWCYAVN